MLKANLESAGIPCVVFSTKDHTYFMTVGFGIVKVLVPKDKKDIALKIIEDLKYSDEDYYE
ncbi:Putative signal transducing protein [Candidatus Kryptonium thompsonii]|nr:Putative signal transducing protein [Candidatus Kryptonium thompsoni]